MLYIMKNADGYYFHCKGKIILFESVQQAQIYLQRFIQWGAQKHLENGDQGAAMTFPMIVQSQTKLMEIDFDPDTVPCGTVYATDLM